jgi:hypothetical protein
MSVEEINEPVTSKTGGIARVSQLTDITSSIQFSLSNISSAVAPTAACLREVQGPEEEQRPDFFDVLRKSLRENKDILEELAHH